MNIDIICVGKLKEKYWTERLSRYCRIRISELKEERLPENASPADEEGVRVAEGRNILKAVCRDSFVIALDIGGKQLSSEQLAHKLDTLAAGGRSDIDMIIGGSLGLSDEVKRRADFRLSFSPMTFPHQMMRVILLEQIYRAFKINRNEPYHK